MLTKTDLIQKIKDSIAPKYFDADDFSDITKSRMGLFGIVSETMGIMYENATINNALKSKERLSITASRSTLLMEAASYPELAIPNAQPAKILIFLGIPVKYLEQYKKVDSSTIEFILHKDTIVKVSQYNFLMDYSVKITGKLINNKFIYSAQYLINNENPLSSILNPYLITTMQYTDGEQYVMMKVIVSQLDKQYQYYNLIELESIPLNGIDFKYDGQLAYFNIFYKEASSGEYVLVDKVNYFSKSVTSGVYIYYDDTVIGVIRLYIPSSFNFTFNSEIRLDIYTTKGALGNFTYNNATAEVIPQSFDSKIDYTASYYKVIIVTDSEGGTNTLSTDEIRNMVIRYKSTLRSVDTENDLYMFFKGLDAINNMTFIKKRIDIFEKQYSSFMVLRNSDKTVMPTNTLNMHLTSTDIDFHYIQTKRRVIKPSTAYSLKPGEDFLVIKDTTVLTDELINSLENDVTKFLFSIPYLMVINEDPPSVSYYLNSIDKDYVTNIEYSNDNSVIQFVINKFNISRNAINDEDTYKIKFNLLPASSLPSGIVDDNGAIIDDTMIKLYGYVYSEDLEDTITGYFPITITSYVKADNYFTAEATLTTDDYITLEDKLRITDSIYPNGELIAQDHITNISNVRFGVGVYYKAIPTDKGIYESIVPNMNLYQISNIYSNDTDRVELMVNISKLIKTIVTFVDEGEGEISFDLKQVPLVRYSYLRSNINRISDIINDTDDILTTLLNQIKNNSSIDYKFYATYGKSRYFTMENTAIKLDRLDISLNFKLRISSIKTDPNIVTDIKTFIQPLIEELNELEVNRSIYFSNIITKVETEFKYNQNRILSFELTKINDYNTIYQSIVNTTKSVDIMTKAELLEYVPEFIRIDLDRITIEILPI